MDKNTFACKSATRVTENPFEQVLGSTTVATVISGKNKMKHVAFVGISSGEEGAAGESQEYPKYPCCTTIGKVCAVDIDTGGKFWGNFCTPFIDADPSTQKFDRKDPKNGVDLEGYSGVTVWSSAPVVLLDNNDRAVRSNGNTPISGQVIVTTGNAYSRGTGSDPSDLSPFQLAVDAFVGVDLQSGLIKNVYRAMPDDFWNTSCGFPPPECTDGDPTTLCNCPEGQGPDYDFGAGASASDTDGDGQVDLLVAVNKAGKAYGLDAATFTPLWTTLVAPTTLLGLGGATSDGERHYFTSPAIFDIDANNNFVCRAWDISTHSLPTGCPTTAQENIVFGPTLTATDHTGNILWQASDPINFSPLIGTICDPANPEFCLPLSRLFGTAPLLGPPTSIPGIVFAESVNPNLFITEFTEDFGSFLTNFCPNFPFSCSLNPSMFAFDSNTGGLLWSYTPTSLFLGFLPIGSPVIAGPMVADGVVYWGALDVGTFGATSTIYAFELPSQP